MNESGATQFDTFVQNDKQSPKMNYSPKHSRKSSSLSSNRKINMKNLSLNLGSSPKLNNEYLNNGRSKSLTISIPDEMKSPITIKHTNDDDNHHHPNNHQTVVQTISPIRISPPKTSNTYKFPSINGNGPHSKSPKGSYESQHEVNNSFLNNFKNLKLPEELQELSQLDAYHNGPANVLNDCIFLYSEPTLDQINDYDLIINVAKECPDLSHQFNDNEENQRQHKKYLYIPWNHTSSISKELPRLTKLIAEYDDSDMIENSLTNTRKRKILIHCHCGVSRSACVVVAYFMLKFNISTNEAYDLLKNGSGSSTNPRLNPYHIDSCNRICPNMSLIFELIDFNDYLKHQSHHHQSTDTIPTLTNDSI